MSENKMIERVRLEEIQSRLREILDEVPFIRTKRWKAQDRAAPRRVTSQVDLVVDLVVAGRKPWQPWRLLVEAKGSGEPRIVRAGIQQIRQLQSVEKKRTYGLVAASYMGPESRRLCKDANVGFIDLAGNCRLSFDQVFVERLGEPNLKVERRSLRSVFTPKASRILRVLLETPKRSWKLQDLAREAKVSLGLTAKVKQRLLDLEFARGEKDGLLLVGAEGLVRGWGADYSFPKGDSLDCYGPGDVSKLEKQLGDYCRRVGMRYGLALFSGAARVAPFARYARGFAYVQEDLASVAKELGWKPVPSGANFTLLAPFDDGLWYGSRNVNGESIVSDLQLYLDLVGYKGRGEEAAKAILEQRLRTQW